MTQAYSTKGMRERAQEAVKNEQMRAAVRKAVDRLESNKNNAALELGQWDDWRERGKQIREHTVENLDFYLGQLSENVRRKGGNIYFADKGEDAIQIVKDICKKHQAKKIVKSKSMVSEEIHLNKALALEGLEVMETDLAEYILQLAGEAPSHIIVPAIHKNRYQIAELFSKVAGNKIPEDTPSLTAFARRILREKFLEADVGITGCNFAVAESGSVVLVTNEGNARLVTTYPKVHIAIMGMERVLPTFEDLEAILTLLPRSATGQKLTSYVSLINGPRREGELDGAEEFHLIVLDNGRINMLEDEEFRQALHCTRCGACFNVCPVYRQIGGHAYASVYGGPIGSVITPLLENDYKYWGELAYASTLCAACSRVCSVKIPLHDLLIKLRHRKMEAGYSGRIERYMFGLWSESWKRPGTYRALMKSASIIQKPLVRGRVIKWGPPPLSSWTNSRYFPALADQSFRSRWRARRNKGVE